MKHITTNQAGHGVAHARQCGLKWSAMLGLVAWIMAGAMGCAAQIEDTLDELSEGGSPIGGGLGGVGGADDWLANAPSLAGIFQVPGDSNSAPTGGSGGEGSTSTDPTGDGALDEFSDEDPFDEDLSGEDPEEVIEGFRETVWAIEGELVNGALEGAGEILDFEVKPGATEEVMHCLIQFDLTSAPASGCSECSVALTLSTSNVTVVVDEQLGCRDRGLGVELVPSAMTLGIVEESLRQQVNSEWTELDGYGELDAATGEVFMEWDVTASAGNADP